MEDDGRSRAASAFCGGGVAAGEAFGGFVRGVRRLPSDWIPMAGTLSRPRGGRHCRAQPQTPPQSRTDRLRARTTGGPDASAVSRLGCAQASGPARSRRPCADPQHHPPHPLRYHLVPDQDRRSPATQRFERCAPNELWQMDLKGPSRWPQPVGPLSVLDDHSRYLVALAANGSTLASPVQQQLIEAFERCGLPQAMLLDHGTPWWSPRAASGTHLALWLMRQGIRLYWSGIRHPQTQGKVERFHGALQRALDRRGPLPPQLQPWLDDYRWEHNHVRPHEALAMQTPASRWYPSLRRYNPDPPRWAYPEGAWVLT